MPESKMKTVNTEHAMIAALVLVVFVASYYYFSMQLHESQVNGLKMLSRGDPFSEMKSILADKKIVMKEFLYPGEDVRNSYVGVVASEIAGALGSFNKSVGVYGYVPEETNESRRLILCTEDTDFCGNEKIIVQLDGCNCVKIQGGRIYVLYEQDKLKDTRLRLQLRGTFGGVLKG